MARCESLTYCEGCDSHQWGVRTYRVKHYGSEQWETVRYCPDCRDLAEINWNGETEQIKETTDA